MHEYLIHVWSAFELHRQQKSSAIVCKTYMHMAMARNMLQNNIWFLFRTATHVLVTPYSIAEENCLHCVGWKSGLDNYVWCLYYNSVIGKLRLCVNFVPVYKVQCKKSTTALMDGDNAEMFTVLLLFMSWTITVCKHNDFDHSGWYHWSMNEACCIVQWASCWAQGTYRHIPGPEPAILDWYGQCDDGRTMHKC